MSDLDDASDVHASAERLTAFLEADEPEIRRFVRMALQSEGLEVFER